MRGRRRTAAAAAGLLFGLAFAMPGAPAVGQEAPACPATPQPDTTAVQPPEPGPEGGSDPSAGCEATTEEAVGTTVPTTAPTTAAEADPGARTAAAAAVEVVAAEPRAVTAPPAQTADTKNCSDFTYREDAQAQFNLDQTDPHNLDDDNDGLACEELPLRPVAGAAPVAPATTATPRTAAPAATPAMPTSGANTVPPTVVGVMFVVVGMRLARAGRRRRELAEFRILAFGPEAQVKDRIRAA